MRALVVMSADAKDEFAAFFDAAERRLRLALTGAFGVETGRDATAEALAWAWQNWGDVREMTNPVGYIYRVGRSNALRGLDRDVASATSTIEAHPSDWELPNYEPNLAKFLARLPERQRVAVWMVHGLGFSHREVAELLECSRPTVATHVRRGVRKLRHHLGVDDE
jgi:RNA polymerase sigma factor (sigma-70 family)